jgi:hypothetical protein
MFFPMRYILLFLLVVLIVSGCADEQGVPSFFTVNLDEEQSITVDWDSIQRSELDTNEVNLIFIADFEIDRGMIQTFYVEGEDGPVYYLQFVDARFLDTDIDEAYYEIQAENLITILSGGGSAVFKPRRDHPPPVNKSM